MGLDFWVVSALGNPIRIIVIIDRMEDVVHDLERSHCTADEYSETSN